MQLRIRRARLVLTLIYTSTVALASVAAAQDLSEGHPADRALESGNWQAALAGYRALLDDDPANGTTWLRIAQSQRGLGQFEEALESLELAQVGAGPAAMIDLERARNLAGLGRTGDALAALEAADHFGLRALPPFEDAPEFAILRSEQRFQRVYQNVRRRIFPCLSMASASAFDFWLGSWEVRTADGTLVGRSEVSRRGGGCSVVEEWQGSGGSTGTSISYYVPSRDQWRHVWAGSSGRLIDMTGGPVDDGMRLEGTMEYVDRDLVVAFRGTWTRLEDGTIRQHFEEFNLAASGWATWFDGFYRSTSPP
ncbi:MAG TPA: tetratricopeptide repeat protein [Gammaproteobacteria bacterium]